jgi:(E)-4-hydroxy-3-methylbut-2-enyl-diphosphate synthase
MGAEGPEPGLGSGSLSPGPGEGLYKRSRGIMVGSVAIGGGAPVVVQTMTNTDTRDAKETLRSVRLLAALGAELVRVAVPDRKAALSVYEISSQSPVPIIADIHFNYRLALESLKAGAMGVRVNPGNIGGDDKLRMVSEACGKAGAALRVGVNVGSLDKEIASRMGLGPEAMTLSALKALKVAEETGLRNIKVSLKASNLKDTVAAARLFSKRSDTPLHLGVTEAGDIIGGVAKSAAAFALLLSDGIGDTIRVSLTAPPEDEVRAGYEILRALGLRERGVEFVSCPTCGRCEIDLIALLADVKDRLKDIKTPLKVAVMGCVVNGPGEAREADLGVAGGKGKGTLFLKGKRVADYPYEELAPRLEARARELANEE